MRQIEPESMLAHNSQAGYTLIEVMVVMVIIAILGAMGASAFVAARNSSMVDAVTDEIVNNVRTAQNNAIAVRNGGVCPTNHGTTKIWSVQVYHAGGDNFRIVTTCGGGSANPTATASTDDIIYKDNLSPYPSVSISTLYAAQPSEAYFSTPFGQGYIFSGTGPTWLLNATSPAQNWVPSVASSTALTWTVSRNGYSRTIHIDPNGDIYED